MNELLYDGVLAAGIRLAFGCVVMAGASVLTGASQGEDIASAGSGDASPVANPDTRSVTPAFNPDPDRSQEYDYLERHETVIKLIRQHPWDVIFIGDSITHYWGGEPTARFVRGGESWAKYYGSRRAINLGCGWDRTEHVLWRIRNGELDGVSAKVVVVLIGCNNLGSGYTAASTAAGIHAVCRAIAGKLPETKILLLGILPRGGGDAHDPMRELVKETNRLAAQVADGKRVFFLDVGDRLLSEDGRIAPEMTSDFLHPAEKGYDVLGQAIEPTLAKLLEP